MTTLRSLLNLHSPITEDALTQKPFSWRPDSWFRRFPASEDREHAMRHQVLKELASTPESVSEQQRRLIGRTTVTDMAAPERLRGEGGSYDPERVLSVFLASMIWGYGMVGYGPYRTQRMLNHGSDDAEYSALAQLVEVAQIAQQTQDGGLRAFEHIAEARSGGRSYLKYLGPAFGTKFIYFLTKASPEVATAPVLDSVVAGWIQRNAPEVERLRISSWCTNSYKHYAETLQKWAEDLPRTTAGRQLEVDDVELLIFQDARGISPSDARSENVTVESMLEDLGAEADARGGDADQAGVELIEELREWFAKYPSTEESDEKEE